MSKIKIQGNADGTGTLTIAAPNTNTDRTLTLPDGAGEILTDATGLTSSSSLNAANLTGALPAIDGSALTGLAGAVESSTYATTGYVKLEDGLIINWFYGYVGTSNFTVTWAQTYPTTFIGTWASMGNNTYTSNDYLNYIHSQNNSSVTVGNAVGGYAQLISIGY